MNVLYVTAHYPYGGEAEAFLHPELEALANSGVCVWVFPVRRQGSARALPTGVHMADERLRPSALDAHAAVRGSIVTVRESLLRSPLRLARNVAIIPSLFRLLPALRRLRIEHIHAHWLAHTATLAWAASRVSGIPFSITAHRWDIYSENLFDAKARSASFVRFISEQGAKVFQQTCAVPGNIVVVHMGVDVDVSATAGGQLERSAERSVGEFRLVSAGNLLPVKGHSYAIEAVSLMRSQDLHVSLDIYGEGPLRDVLESQIESLDLSGAVELKGAIGRADLLESYRTGEYDCYVMPSVDLGGGLHEGVPVSLMEAMANRLPVVATETGAIGELVKSGRTGILVEDKSAAAIAASVEMLMRNRDLGRLLGEQGARHVAREFDSGRTALELKTLFESHRAGASRGAIP